MLPKFFGQYLRDKSLISGNQLIKAVDYQADRLSKLGEIGVQKGYLTEEQTAEINFYQRRLDIKFGEFAVVMRYLTDKQLDELLTIQEQNHIFLGEALVQLGYIEDWEKERELDFFRKEQAVFEGLDSIVAKTIGDSDKILSILDTTVKAFRRVGGIHAKIGFLSSERSKIDNLYITTIIRFYGSEGFKYFLNLPREVALKLTGSICEKEPDEISQIDIRRCVEEFSDIVCWVVKADLLEIGKHINLGEPDCYSKSTGDAIHVNSNEEVLEFSSVTPHGYFSVGMIRNKLSGI